MVQKSKKTKRARQSVPIREESELVSEGRELADRKLIESVSKGRVKKPTTLQKFGSAIFGGNREGSVGQYILWDVLIPAAKSTIQEIVESGIQMLLFGDASPRRHRDGPRGSIVSYGSFFRGSRDPYVRSRDSRDYIRRPTYSNRLNGISFESRGEAEMVLDAMLDQLEQYEEVSISDFYDLAGLSNMSQFTDNSWGWTSLNQARIMGTSSGYEIDFPRPIQLD